LFLRIQEIVIISLSNKRNIMVECSAYHKAAAGQFLVRNFVLRESLAGSDAGHLRVRVRVRFKVI
jgi:hypothetical protein